MEENNNFCLANWNYYSKAVGMDKWHLADNAKTVSILLSIIGKQQNRPEAALAAIKTKVVRGRNLFVDRLDFFSANQVSAETIDVFVSRSMIFAKNCKFAGLEAELVP